jgi:hypothetical protein
MKKFCFISGMEVATEKGDSWSRELHRSRGRRDRDGESNLADNSTGELLHVRPSR